VGARGKKPAAEMEVAAAIKVPAGAPKPPSYLPASEKKEWTEIVAAYPSDRFPRATWPMLEAYCRHAVNARRIGNMIDKITAKKSDPDVKEFSQLLSMLNRETKTLASFGVRLGIARTSLGGRHNDDPETTRTSSREKQPWEA